MTRHWLLLIPGMLGGACLLSGCFRPWANEPSPCGCDLQGPGVNIVFAGIPEEPKPVAEEPSETTGPSRVTFGTIFVPLEEKGKTSANDKKPSPLTGPVLVKGVVKSEPKATPEKGNLAADDKKSPLLTGPGLVKDVVKSEPKATPVIGPAASEAPVPKGPSGITGDAPKSGPDEAEELQVQSSPASRETAREPLLEAVQCILENKHSKAVECLKSYDADTQDFLMRLLPAMARLTEKPLDKLSHKEVTLLQVQFEEMVDNLRPRSDLVIHQMCFCKTIKSFGVYEPLPKGHLFHAGGPGQLGERVQLYVELGNICSRRREPFHETRLSSSVEIRDASNPKAAPIWYYRFEDGKQPVRSRSQLHDFFNYYTFSVPHIPAGIYTLTIHIVDETCPDQKRHASHSLPFQVTSMPSR